MKQKNQPFSAHLPLFRHILGDPHSDEEAIKDQLYKSLQDDLKDALLRYGSLDGNPKVVIANCKNV